MLQITDLWLGVQSKILYAILVVLYAECNCQNISILLGSDMERMRGEMEGAWPWDGKDALKVELVEV